MYTIYVLLFLGAFVPFAFIAIFVVGSLIHSVSLGKEALQALSRACNVKAETHRFNSPAQLRSPLQRAPAEINAQGEIAYVAA
jgi:hypothetical protein